MDLKYEFEKILDEYGHYVLLVHADKTERCSCFDEKTQEACRRCPVCSGVGYVNTVEDVLTRDVDTAVPESLVLLERAGGMGGMSIPGRQYYFKNEVSVGVGDLIVDVEWYDDGRPYYTNGGIYEISHIDPNRFKGGEHVFHKVYCKDEVINKHIRGIRIVERYGIKNYEIAVEGGLL